MDARATAMSDYMFMLEGHLSASQNRVVAAVRQAAASANVNLFLTGGAMRDMLGGYPVRDLDFSVEGNALKLAKVVAERAGARILGTDEVYRSAELLFPGDVTASIAMAREEKYAKTGAKPRISPATIYGDLKGRDFTINAVALSLNDASLGLLIDPTNGLADLEHKELRAVHNYVFFDDPARLLRVIRFRSSLGFTLESRTQQQYENARLEELEKLIPPRKLAEELRQMAQEPNAGEILRVLDEEKLLGLFSPALTGPKLNLAGFARLQKAKQLIPFGVEFRSNELGLFLYILMEKLTPKERAALIKAASMRKSEVDARRNLEARCRKSEREMKSAKLRKASQVYHAFSKVPGEEILFLLLRSSQRIVQDRIRNYLQKYLPAAQEITDRQVAAAGAEPGTSKFRTLRAEMITARLDERVKKAAESGPEEGGEKTGTAPAAAAAPESKGKGNHEDHRPSRFSPQRKPRAAAARRE